jgi:hypothetical protein
MIESSKIRFAGDVAIDEINIVTLNGMTQNITNQVISIEIFEDLFSPFITGAITVKDSYDFVNLLPFVGEELINVKIYTPSFEQKDYIEQQFYIYKITDRIITGDRKVFYRLHIISKEAVADVNKNISKAYDGKVSDIAKTIITDKYHGLESVKTPVIEESSNKTKFISNYWTPVKSLNYLANVAKTATGGSNYLFFENRKGLNFVSLEYLYNQPPVIEFVYDNYARDIEADGRSTINLNEDYKRILELDIPVVNNYLDRASSGMFASKIISIDPFTKKYLSKNFSITDDYENTYHLNSHSPFSKNNISQPNSRIIKMPRQYSTFNGYTDISKVTSIQRRISQLAQAETTKINITVLGRTDYTVGMKVKVELNKIQPIAKEELPQEILDEILSGFYIVSAINHSISREKHECSMELIKDSYIMDLNKGKI